MCVCVCEVGSGCSSAAAAQRGLPTQGLWHLRGNQAVRSVLKCLHCSVLPTAYNAHRRNFILVGGGGDNFFLPASSVLLATELKMDKLKNWGEIGGKCCMYIKDWFKPIFRLFLTSLLCKLKFLILMVDFAPPPPSRIVINQITPVPLRLCITYILIGKVSNVNKLLYLCIYLWFI